MNLNIIVFPKLNLTTKVLLGMISGAAIGLILNWSFGKWGDIVYSLYSFEISLSTLLVNGLFDIVGQIFIASLKMLVVPLVFVSLICGTSSLSDPSQLGRLGTKSFLLYILTTAAAISLAIAAAVFIKPGQGLNLDTTSVYVAQEAPPIVDLVIDFVPENPISAMTEGNMLQIIVFSIFMGIAIAFSKESGKRLAEFFTDINVVIMKLVTILMKFAPYGIFALMAKLFTEIGFDTILSLAKYFMLVLAVLIVHAFVTLRVLLFLFSGLSPKHLYKKIKEPVMFAFSTASSAATLPITIETAQKKLGVDRSVASFTLPLGSTINMDGTAIMQGVATVFIAQLYLVDLSLLDYISVIITATLASIGTAAVPGVGLIMLAMVLQQVGLPVEGIALIIGVDRILDMARTAVNVTGDCTISCIVANSEKKLALDIYEAPIKGTKKQKFPIDTAQIPQTKED